MIFMLSIPKYLFLIFVSIYTSIVFGQSEVIEETVVISAKYPVLLSEVIGSVDSISLKDIEINKNSNDDLISGNNDELYNKAIDIVVKQQKVSTSYIQRYLQIGYNRAARIVEKMEDDGIISEASNSGKRHVLKKE